MKLYITDTQDIDDPEWAEVLDPLLDKDIEWTPRLHESNLCITRVQLKCTMRTKLTTVWITYSQIDDETPTMFWRSIEDVADYLNHYARKDDRKT
jgi:hypothetical protein